MIFVTLYHVKLLPIANSGIALCNPALTHSLNDLSLILHCTKSLAKIKCIHNLSKYIYINVLFI